MIMFVWFQFCLWALTQAEQIDPAWMLKCLEVFDELDVDASGHLDEDDLEQIIESSAVF